MQISHGYESLDPALRGGAAAIGNFDGVHRGHRALIAAAREASVHAGGSPVSVVTFEPHPREYFAPDAPPFRLMNADTISRDAIDTIKVTPDALAGLLAALGGTAYLRGDTGAAMALQGTVRPVTDAPPIRQPVFAADLARIAEYHVRGAAQQALGHRARDRQFALWAGVWQAGLDLQGSRNEGVGSGRWRPIAIVQAQHPEVVETQADDFVQPQHLDRCCGRPRLEHRFAADPAQALQGLGEVADCRKSIHARGTVGRVRCSV